jgi:hypothetical protein
MGDTSTLRRGEQARANMSWQETRAGQLRGEYGLTEADAYRLFDQQTIYLDAKRAADAAAEAQKKVPGGSYNAKLRREAFAAEYDAQQQVMAAAAAESAVVRMDIKAEEVHFAHLFNDGPRKFFMLVRFHADRLDEFFADFMGDVNNGLLLFC